MLLLHKCPLICPNVIRYLVLAGHQGKCKNRKSSHNDTLKVLSSKSSFFIRLDDKKNRVIMTTDYGRTFEFTAESTNEGLDIGYDFPVADWTRLHISYRLQPLITNLAFFLIRRIGIQEYMMLKCSHKIRNYAFAKANQRGVSWILSTGDRVIKTETIEMTLLFLL